MGMIVRACLALALLLAVSATATAREVKSTLAAGDSGAIWFNSAGSLTRVDAQTPLQRAEPIALSGDLQLPDGAGPFAAVVLAHGCSGIVPGQRAWVAVLREWGYATFLMDSFAGRGLTEVCSNAFRLTGIQRVPDAYGALALLQTHPRIDPARIVLMGFSHGGILAMGASTRWAKETFAPAGRPGFRAFVPFYPYCNASYPESGQVSAPLRVHTGEADDWTPAKPCADLVQHLRAGGQDAVITLYPGAAHGFDSPGLTLRHLPQVDNGADCFMRAPSILGPFAGAAANCLRKGAHIGGDPQALQAVRANIRRELAELLGQR
jgi:dienelactone hydrolase